MTKKIEIYDRIDKLETTLKYLERKFKSYHYILENIPQDKLNQVFMRNLYYFLMIIEKIKHNLREVIFIRKLIKNKKIDKRLKYNLKLGAKRKSIIAVVLLEHLINLMKKYNIDSFDFEVQTMIDDDEEIAMKTVPEKFKNIVREEFDSINRNYKLLNDGKLIEPFWKKIVKGIKKALNAVKNALKKAVNFAVSLINKIVGIFKSIFKAMGTIFNMLKKIVMFIVGALLQMIKLFFSLLMMLFNFITKTLPKMIMKLFSFFKLLVLKFKYTGVSIIGLFVFLTLGIGKYWNLLLGDLCVGDDCLDQQIPSKLTSILARFLTLHLWWTQTPLIRETQFSILNFILKVSDTWLRYFCVYILGISENDRFFRYKGRNVGTKISLFFSMFFRNIITIFIRGIIFAIVVKVFGKIIVKKLRSLLPNERELIIFPFVFIRFIVVKTYQLIKIYVLNNKTEEY